MKVYKLRYENKETAIADLKIKEVISEEGNNINGTEAIVEIGLIASTYGSYDDKGFEITETVYFEGYHFDVMSSDILNFGINEIEVNNPRYTFAGY
jgi:hypothetical protein